MRLYSRCCKGLSPVRGLRPGKAVGSGTAAPRLQGIEPRKGIATTERPFGVG